MDSLFSGEESDDEFMSMEMLEDICDGSQYFPSVNSIEAISNIHDRIKQIQVECKGELLSMRNMVKVYTKCFKPS